MERIIKRTDPKSIFLQLYARKLPTGQRLQISAIAAAFSCLSNMVTHLCSFKPKQSFLRSFFQFPSQAAYKAAPDITILSDYSSNEGRIQMSFFRINNQTASFGYRGPEAFSNDASCSKFGTDTAIVWNGKLSVERTFGIVGGSRKVQDFLFPLNFYFKF